MATSITKLDAYQKKMKSNHNLVAEEKSEVRQFQDLNDVEDVKEILSQCEDKLYDALKYLLGQTVGRRPSSPYRGLEIDEFEIEGRRGTRFVCEKGRNMKSEALRRQKKGVK